MSLESRLLKLETIAARTAKDDRSERISEILRKAVDNTVNSEDVEEFEQLLDSYHQ